MPWYDFVWRSAILAVTLLVVTRLLGKRMVAELTPIDFVAGITVGTIAGSASITSNVPMWGGVLALAAWATFQAVNAGLAYRLPAYRRLAVGQGASNSSDRGRSSVRTWPGRTSRPRLSDLSCGLKKYPTCMRSEGWPWSPAESWVSSSGKSGSCSGRGGRFTHRH
jgi:hypothetical protein